MRPVPPTPRAADAGWLLRELTDAHLVEPAAVGPVVDRFRTEVGSDDAAALAAFLVRAGVLTAFQADRALAGESATLVLGPYRLTAPLGTGGMGTVYRAAGRTDGKPYAVKVLPLRSLWNVHRAKRQLGVFAGLPPHPGLIPLVAIDSAAGRHYLAWPLADGVPLDRVAARLAPFPPADAARLAADGLAVCHRHGVVHGLVKPSNLMFGADGRVRLLDLGIGAILTDNLSDAETMFDTISTANTALGMMDCAAPETLAQPTLRTPAGDAYSLGCVLYFLLTGSYPFPDGNAVDKILAHQTRDPVPVRDLSPGVPAALADATARLMRKRPEDRPADLAAVAAELRALTHPGPLPPGATESGIVVLGPDPTPPPAPPVPPSTAPTPVAPAVPPRAVPPGGRRPPAYLPNAKPDEVIDFNLPAPDENVSIPGGHPTPARPVPARFPTPAFPAPGLALPPTQNLRGSGVARVPRAKVTPPPEPAYRLARAWWRVVRTGLPWVAARDAVQLTLFGPTDATAGGRPTFQVFAHRSADFAQVRTLARSGTTPAELLASGYAGELVARGRTLAVRLALPSSGADPVDVEIVWDGTLRAAVAEVRLPKRVPPGQHPGGLDVRVRGRVVARVPFQIGVTPGRGG